MNWVKIFIILIIILAYILLFVKRDNLYINDQIYYSYLDIRDKLRSGDILLFSCRRTQSLYKKLEYYFRTSFIGSEYGHVGLVLKNGDKLYLVECCLGDNCAEEDARFLNNYKKGGVRIISLDKLIEEYSRETDATFAIKFISKEIPWTTVTQVLKVYKNITFQNKSWLYFLGTLDVAVSHPLTVHLSNLADKNKMMCSEFVHDFLYRCGVLDEYPSRIFWPHLFTDDIFHDLEIVKYSRPYKFMKN